MKIEDEKISPTAWTIAFRRTFTDIPYSLEIFNEVESILDEQGTVISDEFRSYAAAPQIEARYKLVNRLLKNNNAQQILEIAAGFSPRGLEMTDNDIISYVEVDLPFIMSDMKNIVDKIGTRKNLYLEDGSALDLQSLKNAAKHFDENKPISVVHEGLLRYLNFDEKAVVARNISYLLKEFGGVWITPDITLKTVIAKENQISNKAVRKVEKTIGMDFSKNAFESIEEAKEFFESQGFFVEKHSFVEVIDELVSPQKLGQTRGEVEALIQLSPVFVMKRK